ncbi:unnamed protein product [Rhizophagus irregularis]|nr:unnamed protein product [Rhizophagus irregularis]CAB5363574.1 unnamed protein product [Rhizophagus irregularis]
MQQNVELEIYGRITADDSGRKISFMILKRILIAACDKGAIEQLSVYVALGKNSMLTWIWKRCWVSKGLLRWRHFVAGLYFTFLAKTNKGGTYAKQRTNKSVSEISFFSVNILNKIVFVGDALVGNEELTKFN